MPPDPLLAAAFPEAGEAGAALLAAGLTVGAAESCTGGLLTAALTAVPGSSAYVVGAVVAYANRAKEELLEVDQRLLAEYGAVSEPVARAMAEGVRRLLGCDVGLAVTGVAGPDGESPAKPPGLVFVACAGPRGINVARLDDDRGREGNRAAAVRAALALATVAARG